MTGFWVHEVRGLHTLGILWGPPVHRLGKANISSAKCGLRWSVEGQTRIRMGKKRWFRDCDRYCQTGWFNPLPTGTLKKLKKLIIYWVLKAWIFVVFTVKSENSLEERALLMSGVGGRWPDWFELYQTSKPMGCSSCHSCRIRTDGVGYNWQGFDEIMEPRVGKTLRWSGQN